MYVSIQDTVVREQANRRPDVIRQVVYKNKERIGPKTDPWNTADSTGTGSEAWPSNTTCWVRPESHELIHLWVDLLSHNSPICVIASCVVHVPYQRPLRNPLWSNLYACVHDSQPHPGCWWYRAQTGPTGFRRTSDFGNHADSQQVCYLRLSACWCYWLIYALKFCSRCMWATLRGMRYCEGVFWDCRWVNFDK